MVFTDNNDMQNSAAITHRYFLLSNFARASKWRILTSYISYQQFVYFIDPPTQPCFMDFSEYFKFGNPCRAISLRKTQASEEVAV